MNQQASSSFSSHMQNKYNRAHIILMGIIVLAVIICVSFVLGMESQRAVDMAVTPYFKELTPTVQPVTTGSLTSASNTTSKIYTGTGFTFSYPESWELQTNPNNPKEVLLYDPASGMNTPDRNGNIIYKNSLGFIATSSDQTVTQYIADVKMQQQETGVSGFQQKTITLNGKSIQTYYVNGEATAGWYIPFANGTTLVEFGPITTDPAEDSIQLDIVKTFSFSK